MPDTTKHEPTAFRFWTSPDLTTAAPVVLVWMPFLYPSPTALGAWVERWEPVRVL